MPEPLDTPIDAEGRPVAPSVKPSEALRNIAAYRSAACRDCWDTSARTLRDEAEEAIPAAERLEREHAEMADMLRAFAECGAADLFPDRDPRDVWLWTPSRTTRQEIIGINLGHIQDARALLRRIEG